MEMLKCSICGKEFGSLEFDKYAAHVQNCAAEAHMKSETEKMKKINEDLAKLKKAKSDYEILDREFKNNYPNVWRKNFGNVNNVRKTVIPINITNDDFARRLMDMF